MKAMKIVRVEHGRELEEGLAFVIFTLYVVLVYFSSLITLLEQWAAKGWTKVRPYLVRVGLALAHWFVVAFMTEHHKELALMHGDLKTHQV